MITEFAKYKNQNIVLYHGTSSNHLDDIENNGLKNPYLTDLYEKAEYYAEEATYEEGGDPIIIQVEVYDENKLRLDNNELDEPVIVIGMLDRDDTNKKIQKYYKQYIKDHPKRYDKKYDVVNIDPKDFRFSLDTVHSVWYDGNIPFSNIKVI